MNALLPKFHTCLVRRYQAGFYPGYWSFVDKQKIMVFFTRAGIILSFSKNCKLLLVSSFLWAKPLLEPPEKNSPSAGRLMGYYYLEKVWRYVAHFGFFLWSNLLYGNRTAKLFIFRLLDKCFRRFNNEFIGTLFRKAKACRTTKGNL